MKNNYKVFILVLGGVIVAGVVLAFLGTMQGSNILVKSDKDNQNVQYDQNQLNNQDSQNNQNKQDEQTIQGNQNDQKEQNDPNNNNGTTEISSETVDAFQAEIVKRGVKKMGQPIEGFDAFLLLQAFPKLLESDFNGVESFEGVYKYNGSLLWERIAGRPITSAEKTISKEGYETLLRNLSKRLNMPASAANEAIAIINLLDR